MTRHDSRRVSPFGHLRINAYVRLPEAFRSLSRPSSPVRAKASTVRPFSLDRIMLARPHLRDVESGPPIPYTRLVLQRLSTPKLTSQSLHPGCQITAIAGVLASRRSTCESFLRMSKAEAVRSPLTRCSRKEVIQPQVPLRLPCYDFAPVTELAFGRCLPCGLAHGLRALPTPMA